MKILWQVEPINAIFWTWFEQINHNYTQLFYCDYRRFLPNEVLICSFEFEPCLLGDRVLNHKAYFGVTFKFNLHLILACNVSFCVHGVFFCLCFFRGIFIVIFWVFSMLRKRKGSLSYKLYIRYTSLDFQTILGLGQIDRVYQLSYLFLGFFE